MTLPPFLQLTAEEEGKVQELAKEVAEQVMVRAALLGTLRHLRPAGAR